MTIIELAAKAIMTEQGCGLTVYGEHVLCDHPDAPDDCRQDDCSCRASARAVLATLAPTYRPSHTDLMVNPELITEEWLAENPPPPLRLTQEKVESTIKKYSYQESNGDVYMNKTWLSNASLAIVNLQGDS